MAYTIYMLVPGVGVVGGTSLTNKKIFIWVSKHKSADTSFALVSAPHRPPGCTWPTPFCPWCCGWGWQIPTIKNSSSGSHKKSADTLFGPVIAPRGAHSLHVLVIGAGVVGGTSQPIKNSSSRSPNKSADTSFAPVSAAQGLQYAHGLHLLVPGAGVVGGTSQPIKKSSSRSPNKYSDTSFAPVSAPQGPKEAIISHLTSK